MSWLAAARKRGLGNIGLVGLALGARRARVEARQLLGALRTRRSSVSLARSSASAASTLGVMSVKVVTMPPSGMWLARTSITRPRSAKRSRNGSRAGDVALDLLAARNRRCASGPTSLRSAVEAQDLGEPDADADQARRQIEDLAELPVPADQLQVLVEHRDALAHVVERGLQDFAVVLDRRIGVVEQLQRRLGRDRALAQQQRQHQPRGGRADRRGEHVLGIAHQLEIGLVLGLEADAAACAAKLSNDGARALLAEIARDRRGQFLDRHRGAPEPEARRDRREIRRHEQVRPAAARSTRARGAARSRHRQGC